MTVRLFALLVVLSSSAFALDPVADCSAPPPHVQGRRFVSPRGTYLLAVAGSAVDTGVPLATATAPGDIQLAGDLGGTAASPTVVGLSHVTGISTGFVPFGGAANTGLTQNNTAGQQLFWDNTNLKLDIGNANTAFNVVGMYIGPGSGAPQIVVDGRDAGAGYPGFLFRGAGTTKAAFVLDANTNDFVVIMGSGTNRAIQIKAGAPDLAMSMAATGVVTLANGLAGSGTATFDLSGASGIFKTSTGAATFGGSSNTFSGTAPQVTLGVSTTTTGSLRLYNSGAATGALTIQSGATAGGGLTITMPVADGSANQMLKTDGSGNLGWRSVETNFSAYNSAAALPGGTAFARTLVTNASTLTADSVIVIDVAGTGTGPLVAKLCSDGTTCAAGNVYLTCTVSGADCTAAAGTITACTVTKAAVAASTTLTWSVTTACGTTDPAFNVNAHMTSP